MLHSTSSGFKPCGELEVLSSKPIEWQFPISTLGIFSNLRAKRIGTLGQSLEKKILFKQTQLRSPGCNVQNPYQHSITLIGSELYPYFMIYFFKKKKTLELGQYNPLVYSKKTRGLVTAPPLKHPTLWQPRHPPSSMHGSGRAATLHGGCGSGEDTLRLLVHLQQ